MASADVLVVMAKFPAARAVKTRLAETVGAEAAAGLYRAFLADIAAHLRAGAWRLIWAVAPPGADLTPWIGADSQQIGQEGDGLAERMQRCIVRLFAAGAPRLVMIGADAPHLTPAVVQRAFAALDAHDVVLMPTRDGGYCLIGLRAPHDVCTGIPMGTREVFARTCARLTALGLRWRALEPGFDIDEVQDVVDLARLLARGEVELPHTAAVLSQWDAAGLLRQGR